MFEWRDLFQWERFITPAIIKIFYMLAVVLVGLSALSGLVTGLGALTTRPFDALIAVAGSVIAGVAGVFLARIVTEFILIVFRINEHLVALRSARGLLHDAMADEPAFLSDAYDR